MCLIVNIHFVSLEMFECLRLVLWMSVLKLSQIEEEYWNYFNCQFVNFYFTTYAALRRHVLAGIN